MDATIYAHYRSDLAGFRGLCALLIIVFHLWIPRPSGGVDAFCVLSGFLMTASIMKSYANDKFSILPFYSRITMRLAPSMLIAVIATLVFGLLIYPELNWIRLAEDSLASTLQYQNTHLMAVATDYFARDSFISPYQQLWFLSSLIQFAAVLPVLLFIGLWLSRRHNNAIPLTALILIPGVASFLYAVLMLSDNPEATYFDPIARAWQFLSGAFVAVVAGSFTLNPVFAGYLGWFGLVLFLFGAYLMPEDALFPGWLALIPVVACMSIILSGLMNSKSAFYRVMSSHYLMLVGKNSLMMYLIHWPLMVFVLFIIGEEYPSLTYGIIIIASAIFLANLLGSYLRRFQDYSSRSRVYIICAAFILVIGGSHTLWSYVNDKIDRIKDDTFEAKAGFKVENKIHALNRVGSLIAPRPSSDQIMRAAFRRYEGKSNKKLCLRDARESDEVFSCTYGDKSSPRTIVLVGASHSHQWLPALDRVAAASKLRLVTFLANGCPLGMAEQPEVCVSWYEKVLAEIQRIKPIFVVSTSTTTKDAQRIEFVPDGFVRFWRELEHIETPFVGIRDNPRFQVHIPQCIASSNDFNEVCSGSRTDKLADQNPSLAYRDPSNRRKFIDMSDYFCSDTICPPIANGYIMYSDQDHITVDYSSGLAEILASKLFRVFPEFIRSGPPDHEPESRQARWHPQ